MEVIFPGFATYGSKTFTFGSADISSGYLGQCLFSWDWLQTLYQQEGSKTDKNQKAVDKSIMSFLKRLFDCVFNNSGNAFKLTTADDPKSNKNIVICDANYVDNKVAVFTIPAAGQGSVCRSVSIVSKVPSEMATAAMVSAQSTITNHTPSAFGAVYSNPNSGQAPATSTPAAALTAALTAVGEAGVKPGLVSSLRSALQGAIAAIKPTNTAIPIPVEFSCTVDGCPGFQFGDAVSCDYLPKALIGPNTAFTVTKVEHNVSDGDWTTTIQTVMRSIP